MRPVYDMQDLLSRISWSYFAKKLKNTCTANLKTEILMKGILHSPTPSRHADHAPYSLTSLFCNRPASQTISTHCSGRPRPTPCAPPPPSVRLPSAAPTATTASARELLRQRSSPPPRGVATGGDARHCSPTFPSPGTDSTIDRIECLMISRFCFITHPKPQTMDRGA